MPSVSGGVGCRELLSAPLGHLHPPRRCTLARLAPSCISRAQGWVLLCQQKSVFLGLIMPLCNQASRGKALLSRSKLHPGWKHGAGRVSPTTRARCRRGYPAPLCPSLPASPPRSRLRASAYWRGPSHATSISAQSGSRAG